LSRRYEKDTRIAAWKLWKYRKNEEPRPASPLQYPHRQPSTSDDFSLALQSGQLLTPSQQGGRKQELVTPVHHSIDQCKCKFVRSYVSSRRTSEPHQRFSRVTTSLENHTWTCDDCLPETTVCRLIRDFDHLCLTPALQQKSALQATVHISIASRHASYCDRSWF
jgi:hypothetical protein